jgi:hypothetical protein
MHHKCTTLHAVPTNNIAMATHCVPTTHLLSRRFELLIRPPIRISSLSAALPVINQPMAKLYCIARWNKRLSHYSPTLRLGCSDSNENAQS